MISATQSPPAAEQPTSKKTVYLSGANSSQDWRSYVKTAYSDSFEFLDSKSSNPKSDTSRDYVAIDQDKKSIDQSDCVLIGWTENYISNTPCEAMYSYFKDIPIIVWQNSGGKLPTWLTYHSTYVGEDLSSCFEVIKDL